MVSKSRLLIVEDNPDVMLYLQKIFSSLLTIDIAENGLIGFEKAVNSLPDIIISDIIMPTSNGLELCKKLKQHPKTHHIPVILLSARVEAIEQLEGLEMGADDYITKPFNPNVLKAKILGALLNRKKLIDYYNRQILLEPTEIKIPDADREILEKSMKIIENNLENPQFNVQILLREMGMSQSVFYRKIKSITGLSVIEFIRDVRIKRAAQLLLNSNLRISEIAMKVGMEDVKYFRKIFVKRYNISPKDFAKNGYSATDALI